MIRRADCQEFTGYVDASGYGRRGRRMAHRVAYEENKGPIPEGYQVDHLCGNRLCCNPDHLEAVPQQENLRRMRVSCGHAGRIPGKKCAECKREARHTRGWKPR